MGVSGLTLKAAQSPHAGACYELQRTQLRCVQRQFFLSTFAFKNLHTSSRTASVLVLLLFNGCAQRTNATLFRERIGLESSEQQRKCTSTPHHDLCQRSRIHVHVGLHLHVCTAKCVIQICRYNTFTHKNRNPYIHTYTHINKIRPYTPAYINA